MSNKTLIGDMEIAQSVERSTCNWKVTVRSNLELEGLCRTFSIVSASYAVPVFRMTSHSL